MKGIEIVLFFKGSLLLRMMEKRLEIPIEINKEKKVKAISGKELKRGPEVHRVKL